MHTYADPPCCVVASCSHVTAWLNLKNVLMLHYCLRFCFFEHVNELTYVFTKRWRTRYFVFSFSPPFGTSLADRAALLALCISVPIVAWFSALSVFCVPFHLVFMCLLLSPVTCALHMPQNQLPIQTHFLFNSSERLISVARFVRVGLFF